MIRACDEADFDTILAVVNEAAEAYRGVIPPDRWREPYMTADYLRSEIEAGVRFFCVEDQGEVLGVMGIQDVRDVTLVRHAYVRTTAQRRGAGGRLLAHLCDLTERPLLMGTWADATWAVSFYEKYGFKRVGRLETARLLRTYWDIPERQVQTSVVLGDARAWRRVVREVS
ncbi:MAG TPA: GNAT family N-acetyltransferase [Coriobacteriia bacterium]|jgi:ribosomal protein S18 acetylase RimI-like enzyme